MEEADPDPASLESANCHCRQPGASLGMHTSPSPQLSSVGPSQPAAGGQTPLPLAPPQSCSLRIPKNRGKALPWSLGAQVTAAGKARGYAAWGEPAATLPRAGAAASGSRENPAYDELLAKARRGNAFVRAIPCTADRGKKLLRKGLPTLPGGRGLAVAVPRRRAGVCCARAGSTDLSPRGHLPVCRGQPGLP